MKNNKEELLNNLFDEAHKQSPLVSFTDLSNQFTKSVNTNVSSQLTQKWHSKLFNLNTLIIMLSTLLLSGIVLFSINGNSNKNQDLKSINLEKHYYVKQTVIKNSEDLKTEAMNAKNGLKAPLNSKSLIINKQHNLRNKADKTNEIIENINPLIQNSINFNPINFKTIRIIDTLKLISHFITERTTENELIQLKQEALAVGIEFKYKVKFRRGYIKMINIKMIIVGDKGISTCQFYCKGSAKDKFDYNIKWNINKVSGKAINFDGQGCFSKELTIYN